MERPWENFYDEHVNADFDYPRVTVADLLLKASEKKPDKNALHFFDYHLTYSDLQKKVEQMAHGLKSLGVKKGDRVGIMLPNCPQYLIFILELFLLALLLYRFRHFTRTMKWPRLLRMRAPKLSFVWISSLVESLILRKIIQ